MKTDLPETSTELERRSPSPGVSGYLPSIPTAAASGDGVASQRSRGRDNITRTYAFVFRDTFDCPPIAGFVQKYLLKSKISVDVFARNKRWATWTNDINPNTAAEYHMDAVDFLQMLKARGVMADLVILDPPYSPRQISECYAEAGIKATMIDTQMARMYAEVKQAASEITSVGGVVLCFGWNSSGMFCFGNYEVLEVLIVCHGASRNDTICMAEQKLEGHPELFLSVADTQPTLAACARGSRSETEQADNDTEMSCREPEAKR